MSDQQPYIDARELYQLLLQSFPTTGKTPQAQEKDRAAYADQVYQMLGFNPLTYQPAEIQPYTPKRSAVKLQYGNDPVVSATLNDIEAGHESSASVAGKLIDPDTGGLTESAQKSGITMAQAQAAVDASKAFEKERASNQVDQLSYEDRQAADPTFGRTKSNAPNANLPDGQLGMEKPNFQYSSGLLDAIQGLDSTPGSIDAPQHLNPAFTIPASLGGWQTQVNLPADQARAQHRPNIQTEIPAHPAFNVDPRQLLPAVLGGSRGRKQATPSGQERAAGAANKWQQFAQKYGSAPQETQANKAAVQRLLQIQAALGG